MSKKIIFKLDLFKESVDSVRKTILNDSFINQSGSLVQLRLSDPVTAINISQEVKNGSNFNLFFTQRFIRALEDL